MVLIEFEKLTTLCQNRLTVSTAKNYAILYHNYVPTYNLLYVLHISVVRQYSTSTKYRITIYSNISLFSYTYVAIYVAVSYLDTVTKGNNL